MAGSRWYGIEKRVPPGDWVWQETPTGYKTRAAAERAMARLASFSEGREQYQVVAHPYHLEPLGSWRGK